MDFRMIPEFTSPETFRQRSGRSRVWGVQPGKLQWTRRCGDVSAQKAQMRLALF